MPTSNDSTKTSVFYKQQNDDLKYLCEVDMPNGDIFQDDEIQFNTQSTINGVNTTLTYVNTKFNPDLYYMQYTSSGGSYNPISTVSTLNIDDSELLDYYDFLFCTYSDKLLNLLLTYVSSTSSEIKDKQTALLFLLTQSNGSGTNTIQPFKLHSQGTDTIFTKICDYIVPQEAVHNILSGKVDNSITNYYYIDMSRIPNNTYVESVDKDAVMASTCKQMTKEFVLDMYKKLKKLKTIKYVTRVPYVGVSVIYGGGYVPIAYNNHTSAFYTKKDNSAPDLWEHIDYDVESHDIYVGYDSSSDIDWTTIAMGFGYGTTDYYRDWKDKNGVSILSYANTINISDTPVEISIEASQIGNSNLYLFCTKRLSNTVTINGYYTTIATSSGAIESKETQFLNNVVLSPTSSFCKKLYVFPSPSPKVYKTIRLVITGSGGTLFDILSSLELNNNTSTLSTYTTNYSVPGNKGISHAGSWRALCLTPDTKITMADGSNKEIRYIKKGDSILCPNGKSDEVIFIDSQLNKHRDSYIVYTFEDTILKIVKDHRAYSVEDDCYKKLSKFKMGEHTLDINGNKVKLTNKEIIEEDTQHCTLWTKNYNAYYANGLLCGNCFANYKNKLKRKFIIGCFRILTFLKLFR